VPAWAWWVLIAVALAAGEVFTLGFFLGAVALAAVVAAVVSLALPVWIQVLVFIVGSLASLGFLRPLARAHMTTPAALRTGTAALVGRRAIVLERVDADSGTVKIGGEVWTARAYMEDAVYEPGARVDVLKIEGATALVSE
jgi:membrane protein implicated in regulation of membrane protease activity